MERYLKSSERRGGQTLVSVQNLSDLPRYAVSKVAFHFLERLSDPSSKEGIKIHLSTAELKIHLSAAQIEIHLNAA